MLTTEAGMLKVEYFQLAFQYYVSARSAAICGFMPVAGTLYHHAIELYLKGHLSGCTTARTRKNLGHELGELWRLVKAIFPNNPELASFDAEVAAIDLFENVRYPEQILKDGLRCMIVRGAPTAGVEGAEHVINVQGLDLLISHLYELPGAPNRLAANASRGGLNDPPLVAILSDLNPEVVKWYPFGVPRP